MWKTAKAAAMVAALLVGTAAIGYAQTSSTPGTGGSTAGGTSSALGTGGSAGAATENPSSSGASMGTSGSSATAPGMEERSEQGLNGPEKRAKHHPARPMEQGPGQR